MRFYKTKKAVIKRIQKGEHIMKKKVKALVGLFLIVAMQLAMVFGASAAKLDMAENHDSISEEGIDPQYVGSCPYGDRHVMLGKGRGNAYYGSYGSKDLRIVSGTLSQCRYCYLALVTEKNPFMNGVTWGNYAIWDPGYQITSSDTVVYTTSFGFTNSLNDPFVQGFDFYNSAR